MKDLTLPEGFKVIARRGGVVLAYNPDYVVEKFVTWLIAPDGGVWCGNYFGSIKSAAIDFENRSESDGPTALNVS